MDDPVQRLLVDRDVIDGDALATQPTLSRFENAVTSRDLLRMGSEVADAVIERQKARRRGRARLITVDFDPTDDRTHGQQEFTFFNAHYGSWCYLPLIGLISFDDEVEQWLVCGLLRPGNSPAGTGLISILWRLLPRLRAAFPGARIRIRLDGGFGGPDLLEYLEDEGVEYVIGLGKNSVLKERAEPLMTKARRASERSEETEHVFGETGYAARSWGPHERRVIIKAEVTRLPGRDPKDHPRFVVTNLRHKPSNVYQIYRGRGQTENHIKELKLDLQIDRTSCSRFLANQLRVLLASAAYVLYQELRYAARHTSLAKARVSTLRERLIKLGVWIEQSVRRVVLHLPDSAPWRDDWMSVARWAGATVT